MSVLRSRGVARWIAAGAALVASTGCGVRVDEGGPLPSASIVRTQNRARAPFATPRPLGSSAPLAVAPSAAPSASPLANVPWTNLDAFALGAQQPKGEVTVTFLPPLVMGGPYAAADVSAAVEAFALNYRTCFASATEKAAKGKPEGGKVNVHFAVSPRGKPSDIELTSTLPASDAKSEVLACVKKWIERVELEPPSGGQPTVAVQMTFARAEPALAGVSFDKLTLDVLKRALKRIGCVRVVDNEGQSPTIVKALCGQPGPDQSGDTLTVVFVPKLEAESSDLPGLELRKKYLEGGAVIEAGGTFVGVLTKPEPLKAPAYLDQLTSLPLAR